MLCSARQNRIESETLQYAARTAAFPHVHVVSLWVNESMQLTQAPFGSWTGSASHGELGLDRFGSLFGTTLNRSLLNKDTKHKHNHSHSSRNADNHEDGGDSGGGGGDEMTTAATTTTPTQQQQQNNNSSNNSWN